MTPSRAADLDALCALRHGVVSQADLVAAGFRADLASYRERSGQWQRLLPGIYLRGRADPTLRQRCYAALLHAGPEAVITGTAGCVLRGVAAVPGDNQEVTVLLPRPAQRVSSGFCRVVSTSQLPPSQILRQEGRVDLVVADLARCVADAIRRAPDLSAARDVAMRALRHKPLDWSAVATMAHRRGPGAGHLRQVVRDVADGVRSPAEADVHDAVRRAAARGSLPPYLLNPDVYVGDELIGSPDLWVVGLGLGDEVDSRQWHGSEDQLDATLQRHARFGAVGLHLNHTTPSRFHADPRAHITQLRALVAARKALAVPEPPGLRVLGRGPLLPAREAWPQVDASRWR